MRHCTFRLDLNSGSGIETWYLAKLRSYIFLSFRFLFFFFFFFFFFIIIIIIFFFFLLLFIIIILIRHQLGLDRPVSASSHSLFKGLPSRLRPFGLQFSIIFGFLFLFTPVTCRSQFDLYLLSFTSTGSTF